MIHHQMLPHSSYAMTSHRWKHIGGELCRIAEQSAVLNPSERFAAQVDRSKSVEMGGTTREVPPGEQWLPGPQPGEDWVGRALVLK